MRKSKLETFLVFFSLLQNCLMFSLKKKEHRKALFISTAIKAASVKLNCHNHFVN
jgi:hypothetical protein